MHSPHSILLKYWQYAHFRPLQEDIINHVLSGKDTLAILPTGGGKSICYQIPGILLPGACIVITPLIALMKDQLLGLKRRGISALAVYSGLTHDEVEEAYRSMSSGEIKFLFVSPERLKSGLFLEYARNWEIGLLAVDEAHCISQWGYDFRPPYLEIAKVRRWLPGIPVIALTASATPMVQKDIIEKLEFGAHKVFFSTFKRKNLSLSALKVDNKIVKLIDIMQKVGGSKIVYCSNRRRTKEVAETLSAHGLSADYYHAGLSQELRSQKQDEWLAHKTEIIVCTNAFGMGIDKPDVRCVVHYDVPDTPETYYQEAGRAGRDGKRAYAVILFHPKNLTALKEGIELRYPPLEKIKEIYESLAYYFGVGIGSGTDETFDFEIADFCKKFDHNVVETLSAVRILAQQEFLDLSESVFIPSKVSVIADRSTLILFEKNFPELDEVLKLLLRMYGGLWNHFLPINEFLMARKMQVAADYIHHKLRELHRLQIINYQPRKDMPQITWLHDRVGLPFLQIDMKLFQTLKLRYIERVEFMMGFMQNTSGCRLNKLISFFGEIEENPCQICDNCLSLKRTLQSDEFESIKNAILQHILENGQLQIDLFLQKLSTYQSENTLKVITYLLGENLLKLNDTGNLVLSG